MSAANPSPEPAAPRAVVSVCVTCKAPDAVGPTGPALLAALEALGPESGVAVRPVQCLSACKRACAAALSGPGRYTYVFGDLLPETGAAALLEAARTYLADPHGYLLWRERPEPLRRGTVARIPPLDWTTDDGRHPR